MEGIQENNYVIQYRKLTMLEILFNHENNHTDKFYLNKILKNLTNDIKMLSIVIDLNNLNTKLLNFFVRELRKKNISISITITNKNYDSKLLYGSDYPWCYCGYLDSFVNNNLSHIYDENVKVLKKLPKKTQKTVSNVNAINYLYGGHKYD